jgi:NADH-quinone oxidoreductase subunit F
MKDTSFCPLGQSLHLPISSCIKYFRNELAG